jgi:hypothetical protein
VYDQNQGDELVGRREGMMEWIWIVREGLVDD